MWIQKIQCKSSEVRKKTMFYGSFGIKQIKLKSVQIVILKSKPDRFLLNRLPEIMQSSSFK